MTASVFQDAGSLNKRLALQRYNETADGCGGVLVEWIPVSMVWVSIQPQKVSPTLEAQQNIETASHRITLRFREDIASGWRFLFGNRVFSIKSVTDPDETRRYLVCDVEEEGR